MNCPKCNAHEAVKNGFVKGIQRYKCKKCGCQYTRPTAHGQPLKVRMLALALYLSGVSMNMAGRIVGVSGQSVMRWVKTFGLSRPPAPHPAIEEIEIDEARHFMEKNGTFFGCGKYLLIPLDDCSAGNVAMAVRLPFKNFAVE